MLQKLVLLPRCCDNIGMTMADADRHNPAESIKIATPVLVEHVLRFALYDHQWSFVIEEKPWTQKVATQAEYFFR